MLVLLAVRESSELGGAMAPAAVTVRLVSNGSRADDVGSGASEASSLREGAGGETDREEGENKKENK